MIAREAPDGSLVLVDGHLRADLDPEVELPVLVVDLTEEEAGEVLASFDPLSAMAQADVDALKALVDTIPPLPEMLALPVMPFAPIDRADDLIDPLENPTSKPGDLYLLGRHRLLCGNSAKAEDVERLLDGAKPNLMVADPPYGVEYDADWRNHALKANGTPIGSRAIGVVTNDDQADWQDAYELLGNVAYVWMSSLNLHNALRGLTECKSACKNDPLTGVIGVQN